jgi:hypothetical protein
MMKVKPSVYMSVIYSAFSMGFTRRSKSSFLTDLICGKAMRRRVKSVPIFLSLFLSNCTPYSETFDCPPGKGVGCQSLSKVNQMVEEGQLPLEESPEEKIPPKEITPPPIGLKPEAFIEARNNHLHPQTHLKMWMAAYEDGDRIYHEASYVHVPKNKDSAPISCSSDHKSCPSPSVVSWPEHQKM